MAMGRKCAGAAQMPDYPPMPGPGKKVPIGDGYYLIYGFDKPLKMGTVIMKVEIFTADGKKDTSLEVKADADMPSMSGAHGTGDRAFQLSKKGDYLLPISIVMPGDWEIKLTVLKGRKGHLPGEIQFQCIRPFSHGRHGPRSAPRRRRGAGRPPPLFRSAGGRRLLLRGAEGRSTIPRTRTPRCRSRP